MADTDGISEYDPRPNVWEVNEVVAERNTLAVQLRECRVARDHAEAERNRLRVIVDLACAEQLAQEACLRDPAGAMALAVAWNDATDARIAAVAAEVARRAAL